MPTSGQPGDCTFLLKDAHCLLSRFPWLPSRATCSHLREAWLRQHTHYTGKLSQLYLSKQLILFTSLSCQIFLYPSTPFTTVEYSLSQLATSWHKLALQQRPKVREETRLSHYLCISHCHCCLRFLSVPPGFCSHTRVVFFQRKDQIESLSCWSPPRGFKEAAWQ